jgi:hypothetical protein
MNVKSRASRILGRLASYRDLSPGPSAGPPWLEDVGLRQGEEWIGLYENSPGAADDCVVVTSFGLHLRRGQGWEFLGFGQIESVVTVEPKGEVSELRVQRLDGRVTIVPVRGGRDRFRDAWEFMRFLDRAKGDMRGQDCIDPTSGSGT